MPPSPRDELATLWAQHELDFTLLVPCLNEAARVTGVLENVRAIMPTLPFSYELIVVDDGSTDNTSEVVAEYRRLHPEMPIRLFRNPVNLGVARTFVDAVYCGKGKYIRMLGGDNAEPLEVTKTILSQAGKADIILPYNDGFTIQGRGFYRNLLSKVYTWLVNSCSGYSLNYYNGSPVFLRYHAMRWTPNNRGFTGFMADTVTHLLDEGATYLQVKVAAAHVTKRGNSPLTLMNIASTAHTLVEILSRRIGNWGYRLRTKRAMRRQAAREARIAVDHPAQVSFPIPSSGSAVATQFIEERQH